MEFIDIITTSLKYIIDLFLHLDAHLNNLVITLGPWLYLLLFMVIFCETGLVVTPFLPGDSLLFAVGAIAAIDGSPLNIYWLLGLLLTAAILGDAVNYSIGKYFAPRIFFSNNSKFFNKNHLNYAQSFYEKHGGKTIILARFIPIIRTFAPFIAGIGKMRYAHFAAYNICGAVLWVGLLLTAGYLLGNTPLIKKNFHIVILIIIILSILPAAFELIKAQRQRHSKAH